MTLCDSGAQRMTPKGFITAHKVPLQRIASVVAPDVKSQIFVKLEKNRT